MTQPRAILSANEAASVTGVPLKEVHRIIDAGLLKGAVESRAGARLIAGGGLVGLKLVHETSGLLTPEARRRLVRQVLRRPAVKTVQENAVVVDIRPMMKAIRRGLGQLDKARRMVTVEKDVLGGVPCFKGTRIPVHDVAAMIANGDPEPAVLKAYPQLSPEKIRLAVLYANAYPRRGRPRRKPLWRKVRPIASEKGSLDALLRRS